MNYFRNDAVSVLVETVRRHVKFFLFVPEELKSQQMCRFVVKEEVSLFMGVPKQFKTQQMREFVVKEKTSLFMFVPEQLENQQMCEFAVKEEVLLFTCVPDVFKTQEMCEFVVEKETWLFVFAPDWYVTDKILEECKDDEQLEECLRSSKQCKGQKTMIKEELLPITWHSDCVICWCFDEDKKEVLEKLYE